MDDDEVPGVPEWVVTYGDMMSLLLTFFIMLVSMSEIVSEQKFRAVLDSLHQRLGYRFAPQSPPGESFPLNELIERIDYLKLGSFTNDAASTKGTMQTAVDGDDRKVFTQPEGNARRVGETLQPGVDGEIGETDRRTIQAVLSDLRGEPNKVEIRSWLPRATLADVAASHAARNDAYRRAAAVQQAFVDGGIEPLRLRVVVLAAPPGSSLLSDSLQRDGVVTLAVLDTYGESFVGGRSDR